MKVIVFGASGKVGRLVVLKLLKNGYSVRAFVHSSNPFKEDPKLELFKGDIYKSTDVKEAIKGCDIVVSALGSWGTKRKDVVSEGIKSIISGMQNNKVKRVISLTGSDAVSPDDNDGIVTKLFHKILSLSPASKILEDGEKHLNLLVKSHLDWTVLRSPIMNNRGSSKSYKVTSKKPMPWKTVNRLTVAEAMVSILDSKKYIQEAPFIVRK